MIDENDIQRVTDLNALVEGDELQFKREYRFVHLNNTDDGAVFEHKDPNAPAKDRYIILTKDMIDLFGGVPIVAEKC